MLVNKILLLGVLAISGCATTEPVIKVVTQEVKVFVAMPCKETVPVTPDFCFVKLSDTDDIFTQTKCLLSDRKLSIGYEVELLAKLNACVK